MSEPTTTRRAGVRIDVLPISWVKPLTATATVHAATSTVNRSFVPKST